MPFSVVPGAVAGAVGLMAAFAAIASASEGDAEYGAYLGQSCLGCHQISGRYDGIPPIIGWPEDVFVDVMKEYRDKTRANPVMQTVAQPLGEEELAALAAYFGSIGPAD